MSDSKGGEALLTFAHAAAKQAQAKGAEHARVSVSRARGVEVEWRDGQVERVQERTRRGLSVELFVDGRYAAMSTNDLRPEAVDRFLDEAVAEDQIDGSQVLGRYLAGDLEAIVRHLIADVQEVRTLHRLVEAARGQGGERV